MDKYLIVGLGNPGKKYEGTRHNVGAKVVAEFANKLGMDFSESKKFQGLLATGEYKGKKLFILLPLTYMNLSGIAVRLCLQFYKIEISNILIVADDVAIPFGKFRIKENSSSGGQKGVENIIQELNSSAFPRFKVGIGEKKQTDLSGHVLGKFTVEEKKFLPLIIDRATGFIELWLEKGSKEVMNQANVWSACLEIEKNKGKAE